MATRDEEPAALCCPITHNMFVDPVFVPASGNTYERVAVETFWRTRHGRLRDPLTNVVLSSTQVYTNWDKRREVQAWLAEHPERVPAGWDSRDVPPPVSEARTQSSRIFAALEWAHLARFGDVVSFLIMACAVLAGLGFWNVIVCNPLWYVAKPLHHDGIDLHPLPGLNGRVLTGELASASEARGIIPQAKDRAVIIGTERAPLRDARGGDLTTAIFTLGFTGLWLQISMTAHAARAQNAEMPVFLMVLTSPFFYIGARLLRSALAPVINEHWMAVWDDTRMELHTSTLGGLLCWAVRVPEGHLLDLELKTEDVLDGSPNAVLALHLLDPDPGLTGLPTPPPRRSGSTSVVEWGHGLSRKELVAIIKIVKQRLRLPHNDGKTLPGETV